MKIFNKNNKFKKIFNDKNKYSNKELIFIMLVVFLFGLIMGGVFIYGKSPYNSAFSKKIEEFVSTYNDIIDSYYDTVDGEKLLDAGLKGMVGYLGDPYSNYMTSEEALVFNESVQGEYSGIGAQIVINYNSKEIKIGEVFENSPAYKAGLKENDILLAVNNESIEGLTSDQIAQKVKGKTGTNVLIKVKRDNKELEFDIKRGMVETISVNSKIMKVNDKNIGYIMVDIFASNTYLQFKEQLLELEKENIDGLIIDLRGNSGGHLTTVTDMISLFTKKNSVIYQLKTKGKIEKIKDKTIEYREYPIKVLVDSLSASASEVMASSLKENYGATLYGTKTFGKGKVQKAYSLQNGSLVKYTFQEWLTANGNYIDSVGIEPDVLIKYVYSKDKDNQLDKALEDFK